MQPSTCPNCGYHETANGLGMMGRSWKAIQLFGGLVLLLGILLLVEDAASAVTRPGGVDHWVAPVRFLIFSGFALVMSGKLGGWWYRR